MSTRDDKADKCPPQTKLTTHPPQSLKQSLNQLEDKLYNLQACYRFYHCAIHHMTEPDHLETSEEWHLGLFLHQQYLQQQLDTIMEECMAIKQLAH